MPVREASRALEQVVDGGRGAAASAGTAGTCRAAVGISASDLKETALNRQGAKDARK